MIERLRRILSLSDVFLAIGLLLFAAALFHAMQNIKEGRDAAAASEDTLRRILTQNAALAEETTEEAAESGLEDLEIPDYELNPDMEMPLIEIDGVSYIGYLTIPGLGLELPVAWEMSNAQLKLSPCYYTGSIYQDNLVVAAHNYRRHFGQIGTLKAGDKVDFTDGEGHVFHFQTAKVETLGPYDVEQMTQSEYPLTLFTCTLGGKNRVTLRCERVPEVPVGLLPSVEGGS